MYRGITAPLPIGLLGLHGAKNPSMLSAAHFSYVEGVDIDGGLLRKDPGILSLNAVELAAEIVSGTSWSPASDSFVDILFMSSGQVLRSTGSGSTFGDVLASGLNVNLEPPPSFCVAGGETVGSTRKLFMSSASNQMQMLSGLSATMVPISTPPADWASSFPTFAVQHSLRLWGGGNASDPHRIYYSQTGSHQLFTGAGSGTLAIYPGEGERLVGGISFNGVLILWKYPLGVYVVDTRDADVANWSVRPVSRSVGGINQQTIFSVDSDVQYMDHAGGIHLLSATNNTGDVFTSNLSQVAQMDKFVRDNVALSRIRRACAVWYPARRQAWYFMPQKISFENDLRLVVDKSDPNVGIRFLVSRRDITRTCWLRPDDDHVLRPVIAEGGFVQLMDREERNKNGEAYVMEFETGNTDFGYLDESFRYKGKNGEFLEIVADLNTQATLSVQVIWDDILVETMTIDISSEGVALDDFILDTDVLAAAGTKRVRRRLPGSGKHIRLRIKNEGLDEDVSLAAFFVSFSLMDESTGRSP